MSLSLLKKIWSNNENVGTLHKMQFNIIFVISK